MNRFTSKPKRLPATVQTLKLPELTRKSLAALYQAQQIASKEFQTAMTIAVDMLGLDVTLNHGINFDTGEITPAGGPTVPHEPEPQNQNGKPAEVSSV